MLHVADTARRNRILILGAGVSGLCLAVTLARHGISSTVLDRTQQASDSGAGLLLAPNATRILQRLNLLQTTSKLGKVSHGWNILNRAGQILRSLVLPPHLPPALSIRRSALLAHLHSQLLPDSLIDGFEAEAIEIHKDRISLRMAGRDSLECQTLIGADGLRSLTRRHLFPNRQPAFRGYIGWRGIAPYVPQAYASGNLSESWGPGGRFGIAPVSESATYWYASANAAESSVDHAQTRKANLLHRFGRWHQPCADLIEATPESQILVSRIYDAPRLPSWHCGNIALLGDAAHAMTPNLGQGACLAMEDAFTLGSLLAAGNAPAAAFREYQKLRRPRAHSVQLQSRMMGYIVQLENPLLLALRDRFTAVIPEPLVTAAFRSLFRS